MPPPMPPPPRSATGGDTQAAELGGEQQCHGEDGYLGGLPVLFPPPLRIHPPPSLFPSITAVTFTLSLFSGTAATFCHVIPCPAPALAAPRQAQSPPPAAAAMGERCDYQRLSSAEEEEEMLPPLPHSLSDSSGLRAPRMGSSRPGLPPQQDVTLGMTCRRVSVGGDGGSGGTAPVASPGCLWVQGWHGVGGSRWCSLAWHLPLNWHGDSSHPARLRSFPDAWGN